MHADDRRCDPITLLHCVNACGEQRAPGNVLTRSGYLDTMKRGGDVSELLDHRVYAEISD